MTGNAMNTTSQLDLHPDAEILSAFVEQVLGAPEREQVLAHLAGCSRCRQVIFLAQQATADAEVPAARPATQPRAWFWNWRLAWVPAAALAAALALVVTFHPRHTEPAPEMAKVEPPSQAAVPTPLPEKPIVAGVSHQPTPALAKKSVARDVELGARLESAEKLTQEPAPSAAPSAEPGTFGASAGVGHAFMPSSVESAPQPETATQYQPEPAVAAWQQEQQRTTGAHSVSANTSQVSEKRMRAEAYSANAIRPSAPTSSGPRVAQQSQSTTGANFDIGTQRQLAGLTASHRPSPPKLPSGLAAVSRATTQNLTLEIDLAGTLFLSGDFGQHWEQVARQWSGRAVEVRAKTGLSSSTAPATGFELQNDAGSTWASADGKIWTAQ